MIGSQAGESNGRRGHWGVTSMLDVPMDIDVHLWHLTGRGDGISFSFSFVSALLYSLPTVGGEFLGTDEWN